MTEKLPENPVTDPLLDAARNEDETAARLEKHGDDARQHRQLAAWLWELQSLRNEKVGRIVQVETLAPPESVLQKRIDQLVELLDTHEGVRQRMEEEVTKLRLAIDQAGAELIGAPTDVDNKSIAVEARDRAVAILTEARKRIIHVDVESLKEGMRRMLKSLDFKAHGIVHKTGVPWEEDPNAR
jgi:hypothetical protein